LERGWLAHRHCARLATYSGSRATLTGTERREFTIAAAGRERRNKEKRHD